VPAAHAPILNLHFALERAGPVRFIGLLGGLCHWVLVRPAGVSVTVSAADAAIGLPGEHTAAQAWAEIRRAAHAFALPGMAGRAAALPRGEGAARHAAPRPRPAPRAAPPAAGEPGAGRRLDQPGPARHDRERRALRQCGREPAAAGARPMTPSEALSALRAAEARDGRIPVERRRDLLAALDREVIARAAPFAKALAADTGGRSEEETLLADVLGVAEAARHARRHVRAGRARGASPCPTPSCRPAPGRSRCRRAWSHHRPLELPDPALPRPLVDALAAGNRVVVKPSEATPRTAGLIAEVLAAALGPGVALAVQGGPDVAAEFARQPWDHLMFTGGTETGRKVALAAAANLVPVTLELGGKCPAIVLPGADLGRAARAILAGKAINAGQTCIAPDTVLLVGHTQAAFEAACRATGIALPDSPVASDSAAARLDRLLEGASLAPLGPDGPGRRRALALASAPAGAALSREEIFGPILAVEACGSLDAALAWLDAHPPPLAVYLFGATRAEEEGIAQRARAGAIVCNRTVEYAAFPALGFGGVGASGHGLTHGRRGFEQFSVLRARVRHGRLSLSSCSIHRAGIRHARVKKAGKTTIAVLTLRYERSR
jgi:acyl-CoA reductase-like NAD-dependent aldehyde dehydrogenase